MTFISRSFFVHVFEKQNKQDQYNKSMNFKNKSIELPLF